MNYGDRLRPGSWRCEVLVYDGTYRGRYANRNSDGVEEHGWEGRDADGPQRGPVAVLRRGSNKGDVVPMVGSGSELGNQVANIASAARRATVQPACVDAEAGVRAGVHDDPMIRAEL
jgi:hypothetical protein